MRLSRFREVRAQLLADQAFREEVTRERLLMDIDVVEARESSGMTQTIVAQGAAGPPATSAGFGEGR